jgi:hypothetical protein
LPKTLEEFDPSLAVAYSELNNQSARAATLRPDIISRKQRISSNNIQMGNQAENNQRAILGQPPVPEALSDYQQLEKDEQELTALTKSMQSKVGLVQRQKDIASAKLCAMVAPEYTVFVKDVASKMSALHASLTKKYNFLDELESTGASTTALNPISPNGLHPRDTSGILHWAFKEMRENGHISMRDKPTKHHPTRHVAHFIICALYTGSRSARIWRASFEKEEGRPYVDVVNGLFYRTWQGENVPQNKRAPVQRIPARLLAHLRRWRRMGARYVCEYQGRPADPKKAFARLVRAVFPNADTKVVRHTFRHTAATWLMQRRADKFETAGYLGMTLKTLESTYGHHHPDHQSSVGDAFSKKKAATA